MKKILFLMTLIQCFLLISYAETIEFSDLEKPSYLKVYGNRLYINDGASIFIYNMEGYKLLKKFGQRGEGPGEFKTHPNLNNGGVSFGVYKNLILVSSLGRLSFFKPDGDYLKEIVPKSFVGIGEIIRYKNRYVGLGVDTKGKKQYFTVNFYNDKIEKKLELHKILAFEGGKKIDPVSVRLIPNIQILNENILVNDKSGVVLVFNKNGEKLREINIQKFDAYGGDVKITEERIKRYIDYFQSDYRFKDIYKKDKNRFKFFEYFPNIRHFLISGNKIYIITFREKKGEKELFILNNEGKLIKNCWLNIKEINPHEFYPFDIAENKLYQLVENNNTDEWELSIKKID